MDSSEVDYVVDLVRRRWLVSLVVCIIGFGLMPVAALSIRAYTAKADLLIVNEALKDTTLSDPDLPAILTSTEVLGRVINRLKLDTNPTDLAAKIKTKLPVKSSILELTYKDRDGVKAATVANAVADEATSYFHEIATRGYTDVLKALNRRIEESQARIAVADQQLQRASAENLFVSSDKSLDALTSRILELRVQRGQIGAALAADAATASALQRQLHTIEPIVAGEILQKDVTYQQLQNELAKDVADLVSERASFQESFPGLAALERRVDRERGELKSAATVALANGAGLSSSYTATVLDGQRAGGMVDADRGRLRATDDQLLAEQKHLIAIAGAGAAVNTLRAKRDAAVQQYVSLTQRLSTAQGDAAQGASLGRLVVVSRAIAGQPVLPIAWLVGIGLLVTALAIGAALAVEWFDRRLWGVREIEKVYKRPVFIEVGGRS
jgi:uncharacterized protein involved in exopolysaccharide biosynthesis